MSTTPTFYPNIGSIVSASDFPEVLSFLKPKLEQLLSRVYYRHLQYAKSNDGSRGSYSLDIIIPEGIDLDIFDTGFSIRINPGPNDSTSIPLILNYNWPIIGLISNFSVEKFSYSPDQEYDILSKIIKLSDTENISLCIKLFHGGENTSAILDFVNTVNTKYNTTIGQDIIPTPPSGDYNQMVNFVIESIKSHSNFDISIQDIISDLYLNLSISNFKENLKSYALCILNEPLDEYIKRLITPRIDASISKLSIGLVFPRNVLLPVYKKNNGSIISATENDKSIFEFNAGSLSFSTTDGISFDKEMSANLNFVSEIGNTGLRIYFDKVKLDLSRNRNIIEADMDGRSEDFIGIYAKEVSIDLPETWFANSSTSNSSGVTLGLAGYDILAGTGGFSGKVALRATNGKMGANDYLWKSIGQKGGFEIGFKQFDMTFCQNKIIESNISAALKINQFKTKSGAPFQVDVVGNITNDGDFDLTASIPGGVGGTLFDFIDFNFTSFSLGKDDDRFYIGVTCDISFPEENALIHTIMGDEKISISKLRIYTDGSIEFEGGSIPLQKSIHIKITDSISFSVTNMVLGSYEGLDKNKVKRQYCYFGFDSSVNAGPIGLSARGKGLKYYFTTDNSSTKKFNHFLRMESIEVDLILPGDATPETASVIIKGALGLGELGTKDEDEYFGQISLSLPQIGLSAGASMKMNPKYPAFIVDAFVDLPVPIIIGPVGISGFRGLIGQRYEPKRLPDEKWYDYYKRPPLGIDIKKFGTPDETSKSTNPFAIGAGMVVGSADGRAVSVRVMMLFTLPPLFILEGKAKILSGQLGLDPTDTPPFYAAVIWAPDSVEFTIGANLRLPNDPPGKEPDEDEFKILTLDASINGYFPKKNSKGWYLNAGTQEKPISACLFKNVIDFQAYAYLMISARGIDAGAGIDFNFDKKFLGIRVKAYAYVHMEAMISFERTQIGGKLEVGGGVEVNVWRIFFIGAKLETAFSLEFPKPLRVGAEIRAEGTIGIVGFKVSKSVKVKMIWERGEQVIDKSPLTPIADAKSQVKGVHMLTNEAYKLDCLAGGGRQNYDFSNLKPAHIKSVIPVDTFIDIKSSKGLNTTSVTNLGILGTSTDYSEVIPPAGTSDVRQVRHTYSIQKMEVKAYSENEQKWIDYHPFKPYLSQIPEGKFAKEKKDEVKIGYWQCNNDTYDTIRLMALTPFSFLESAEGQRYIPEQQGITASKLFCVEKYLSPATVNVLNKTEGTQLFFNSNQGYMIKGIKFSIPQKNESPFIRKSEKNPLNSMVINNRINSFGFARSLSFSSFNTLEIDLMDRVVEFELKLSSYSRYVIISYYQSMSSKSLIRQETKSFINGDQTVKYNAKDTPCCIIRITPVAPEIERISALRAEIDTLFNETYTANINSGSDGIVIIPRNVVKYNKLANKIQNLLFEASHLLTPACENEKMCELFKLLIKFYPDEKSTITQSDVQKAQSFKELIDQHSHEELNEVLGEYYTEYSRTLSLLQTAINQQSSKSAEYYNELNEFAYQIMQSLHKYGNCYANINDDFSWISTTFHEIRYVSEQKRIAYDGKIEAVEDQSFQQEVMQQTIQHIVQPVWRPETAYLIYFTLQDEVEEVKSNSTKVPYQFHYCYGFKTARNTGFIEKDSRVTNDDDFTFSEYLNGKRTERLNKLSEYIDYNRSYPNADGDLLQAKPLFYEMNECKINLFFAKPYVQHLLSDFPPYLNERENEEGEIEYDEIFPSQTYQFAIKIKDPVSKTLLEYPLTADIKKTLPVCGSHSGWKPDFHPRAVEAYDLLDRLTIHPNVSCSLNIGSPIVPKNSSYEIIPANLKPQKLYTALFYNADGDTENKDFRELEVLENNKTIEHLKEIHQFVFQTSRYGNFREQIASYSQGGKKAIFELAERIDSLYVEKALKVFTNDKEESMSSEEKELLSRFPHKFDRIMEGVFKLPPMEASVGTEFNLIRSKKNTIVALLIRNPEPFNNPRIPQEELNETIKVLTSKYPEHNCSIQGCVKGKCTDPYAAYLAKDYFTIVSRDASQVIIMHRTGDLTNGGTMKSLNIFFKYILWEDGAVNEEKTKNGKGNIIYDNGKYTMYDRACVNIPLK